MSDPRKAIATACWALCLSLAGAPASTADFNRCAAIADDGQRLACYDELVGRADQAEAERDDQDNIQDEIIDRCRREMASYGSAMVKACVDRDIEAYQALQSYPSEYSEMADRCEREMVTYGWSMVKACADRDIEAERALSNMIKRQ